MRLRAKFTRFVDQWHGGGRARGLIALAGAVIALFVIAAANAGAQGISEEEEYLGIPPPPIIRPATVIGDMIVLRWDPPRHIRLSQAPGYDPEVAWYRVYRIKRGRDPTLPNATLVGQTIELFFLVHTPPSGDRERYAVTAVQKSGQESPLSLTIDLPAEAN